MRRLFLPLVIALLAAAAPAAQAQGTPALTLHIEVPSAPVDAGNASDLALHVTRVCANAVTVLDPQRVRIAMVPGIDPESGEPGSATWTIDGPEQAMFPQQVCATQPQLTISLAYQASPEPSAQAGKHPFTVKVAADEVSLTTPAIAEVPQNFVLSVAEPPPAPAVVEQQPERESPGLGGIGALVALAAAVVATLRRR